jgi:hypothetical protein
MAKNIHDVLQSIKDISLSESALTTMLDFERVVSELDVYAFENWKKGELVEGPVYEKYFITCTFMWPYKKMPDPRGGEQLLNYNCEVSYKKDELEFPVKIKDGNDFEPGTKVAKTNKTPVWLVTITMPKKLMAEINQGSVDLENDTLDMEDVEQAYEEGYDEEEAKDQDPGAGMDQGMGGMDQGMGGMGQQGQGGMSPLGGPNGQQQ